MFYRSPHPALTEPTVPLPDPHWLPFRPQRPSPSSPIESLRPPAQGRPGTAPHRDYRPLTWLPEDPPTYIAPGRSPSTLTARLSLWLRGTLTILHPSASRCYEHSPPSPPPTSPDTHLTPVDPGNSVHTTTLRIPAKHFPTSPLRAAAPLKHSESPSVELPPLPHKPSASPELPAVPLASPTQSTVPL